MPAVPQSWTIAWRRHTRRRGASDMGEGTCVGLLPCRLPSCSSPGCHVDLVLLLHPTARLACYYLEEFESALDAFEAAAALEPGKSIHTTWANMCRVQMGGGWAPEGWGTRIEWTVIV